MYNLLKVIGVETARRSDFGTRLRDASDSLPGAVGKLLAPTLPGTYAGGDFIWRVSFPDRAAANAALGSEAGKAALALIADESLVTSLDQVAFTTGAQGGTAHAPAGLYRAALFCADRNPTSERLSAFAHDTLDMPKHVRTIVRWELSEAGEASGMMDWTHVWEQEYPDLGGLNGAYMLHPVHWAHVERWFDTEYPDYLVSPRLVHTFCATDRAILNQQAGPD